MNEKFEQDDSRTESERRKKWRIFRAKHGKLLKLNAFDKQGAAFVLTLAIGIVGVSAAWYTGQRLEEKNAPPLEDTYELQAELPEEAEEETLPTFEESPYTAFEEQAEAEEDVPTAVEVTREDVLSTLRTPVEGQIVQEFSIDALRYNDTLGQWSTHNGVDYAAKEGTQVFAALDGVVEKVESDPLLGRVITVSHDCGIKSRYAGLGNVAETVAEGVRLCAGDVIGTVGTSAVFEAHLGAHLHFELMEGEAYLNPIAP